jgi:hypothetical protein
MAELTINVTFKVSDEAYEAYQNCVYQEYLHDELADIMFTVFRDQCFKRNPSEQIIVLAKAFNDQADEMIEQTGAV